MRLTPGSFRLFTITVTAAVMVACLSGTPVMAASAGGSSAGGSSGGAVATPPPITNQKAGKTSPEEKAQEEKSVRAAFDGMRRAFRAGDGPTLLSLLSTTTRERLKVIHDAARRRVTINQPKLNPSEKLLAGALERAVSPSDLRRHDLGEVLGRALQRPGGIRKDAESIDLGGISVNGDTARASLFVKGAPTMFPVDLIRENGGWRLDLTGAVHAGDMVLTGLAGLKGTTTDALIEQILSRMHRQLRQAG